MARPIHPRRLVRHAWAVAHRRSGAGRPVVTWLRRSTSASYYAVFHAIALAVVAQICPEADEEDRYRLARSVGHRAVADVCRWIVVDGGRQHSKPVVASLRENRDLVELAEIFVQLQQARHDADYDHLAAIRKATTLTHHGQAVRALDLVDGLRGSTDGQRFLALIALHTSLS